MVAAVADLTGAFAKSGQTRAVSRQDLSQCRRGQGNEDNSKESLGRPDRVDEEINEERGAEVFLFFSGMGRDGDGVAVCFLLRSVVHVH